MWSRASVYLSVCVCLSAAVRPHYCTDPDVTWGHGRGCPLVVHIERICNRGTGCVAMAHNANPSYKLASIPRYDDIVRTAGLAGSARAAGRRPAADGGRSQHYCGSLECGLPLVAFWQQKANAKC